MPFYNIFFDHVWGSTEQADLQMSRALCRVEIDEEVDAVEEGWLAQDKPMKFSRRGTPHEVFYQSRSTRIDLNRWKSKHKTYTYQGEKLEVMQIHPTDKTVWMTGMHKIYKNYLARKGYKDLYNPLEHIRKRDSFLIYFQKDVSNILGFTKMKYYSCRSDMEDGFGWHGGGRRSNQKPWPGLPIGAVETYMHCNVADIAQITLDMECRYWQERGAPHLYTGPGYEKSSVYKSHNDGFEWWTGWQWSTDVSRYRKLCERDSTIKTMEDLSRVKS